MNLNSLGTGKKFLRLLQSNRPQKPLPRSVINERHELQAEEEQTPASDKKGD